MNRITHLGRLEGWEQRLQDWAAARAGLPFEWGKTDCAVLCAEAFDLMAGTDYASSLRGSYATASEAARYQRRIANLWDGLRGAGCVVLPSPLAATLGDFLVGRRKGFWCGHVCLGATCLSSDAKTGVGVADTLDLWIRLDLRALRLGPCRP